MSFIKRFKEIFDQANAATIAEKLGVTHTTASNYLKGRLPAADVLIAIADQTKVSLNWLLTGDGQKYALDFSKHELKAIEEVGSHLRKNDAQTITQLVREKLDELGKIEFDEITIPIYQMYEELPTERKAEIADVLIKQIMAKAS